MVERRENSLKPEHVSNYKTMGEPPPHDDLPGNLGTSDEDDSFVVQIYSPKLVTEKIIRNLMTRTKFLDPY